MSHELPPSDASAHAHASVAIPIASPGETVGVVRARMVGADRYESATDIAVLDGDHLAGLVRIEDLLAARHDLPVSSIMDSDPPVVAPGADQEQAATRAVDRSESSLAVVAADGRFLGLIPAHRMLGVLLEEHREDIARMSGYVHQRASARSASEESIPLRFRHRFPYLLVGLAAALAAAGLVAGFEQGLSSRLELVFFIPGIVYIADAVGNQTVTLMVRGLSVGVPVGRVMWRELVTGVLLGAVLAGIALPVVAFWFDFPIALTVSASIWGASTMATGVAMALPWIFSKLNLDPAFGSGPLSTVVQDLLSLAIYFWLAAALLV